MRSRLGISAKIPVNFTDILEYILPRHKARKSMKKINFFFYLKILSINFPSGLCSIGLINLGFSSL